MHGVISGAPRAYRVLGLVDQGGSGAVYRAELLGAGGFVRRVAIKVLHPDLAADPELEQRLRDEARMLAMVRHRAIVAVDELTVLDDRWAVVMELVDGADLGRLLGRGPMPVRAALELVAEVAAALHAVHCALGPDGAPLVLVHGDLKPSRVLITRHGEVKVAGLGAARAVSDGYAAPERAELVDGPESDVYGLGGLLVEAVTGERLRAAHHPRRHGNRVAEAVERARAAGVPEDGGDLLTEMLCFAPGARPDAEEVEARARALAAASAGPGLRAWAADVLARPVWDGEAPADRDERDDSVDDTVQDHTVWEAVDASPTVASVIPSPARATVVLPRLPPAPPRAEKRTVLLDRLPEPAVAAAAGPGLGTRVAWAVVALSPVPVAGSVLAASFVGLWWALRA